MENHSKRNNDDQLIEERRKFVRLNINVEINYTIITLPPHKQFTIPIQSKNIGGGGICLISEQELKTGELLKLEIKLPEDPPTVHALGRVVWVKPFSLATEKSKRFDMGVEFIEISQEDRQRINKYVFSLK